MIYYEVDTIVLIFTGWTAADISKHLYPMVLAVTDDNIPIRHDGDALQPLELRVAAAPGAEGS